MSETETTFPIKTKRQPKLVVFNERELTRNRKPCTREKSKSKVDIDENDIDFVSIAREVKEFGVTGFTRKEQKRSKQKYAESLGAKKVKPQKVPYKMLMERIKVRKAKEEKTREMERAMGVFKKKRKGEQVKVSQTLNLGRWVDKSTTDRRTGNNSIKVNKKDIAKLKK